MLFSIIIPAYNAADRIRAALDSVAKQTYKDYELIVVCDACEDDTAKIAREYTDKVFEVPYHNEGLARNCGLDHAVGDWVLWIDDDDYWLHEYVLEQLSEQVPDQIDALCFSFIFKGRGYAAPSGNRGCHWIAVWTKCWRRSFIGDTRFGTEVPCDVNFNVRMMKKRPRLRDWDMPLYYYNYMRPGSTTWKLMKGVQV